MNKIMYVARWGAIETIEVTHETEKTVTEKCNFLGPVTSRKATSERLICDTWEEAHQWLVADQKRKVDGAVKAHAQALARLRSIAAMTPPEAPILPTSQATA